jgi:multiple antibiotic resistance protein
VIPLDSLEFLFLCLSTLISLVNPLGMAPLFLVLTDRFNPNERIAIAKKGMMTAVIVLIVFALVGSYIFKFYALTVDAFRITGGIIFFRNGLRMLEAKISRGRSTPKETEESLESNEIAVSPIGIPIIAGPGAITASMILSGEAHNFLEYGILIFSILFTLMLTFYIFRGADRLSVKLGTTGLRIIQRIMGILLMVIAVQFVINGITPVLETILGNNL